MQVVDESLHETKNEILREIAGELGRVEKLSTVDQIRETHIRFRNITDYDQYTNAIGLGYDSEDAIFSGYNQKIKTPKINLVKRSLFGDGCDFKHEMIESRGRNCFIPTKLYYFIKCNFFLTGVDYKQQNLDFIRNKKDDLVLRLWLVYNHFVELIILILDILMVK